LGQNHIVIPALWVQLNAAGQVLQAVPGHCDQRLAAPEPLVSGCGRQVPVNKLVPVNHF